MSGIVGIVYALLSKKVTNNVVILAILGSIAIIFILVQIRAIDKKQDKLLKELEKEE